MTETFTDYEIQCVDCGASFTFKAEDQEFYQAKGFSEPRRCPACRQARKMNSNRNRNRY